MDPEHTRAIGPVTGFDEFTLADTEQSISARFESRARLHPHRIAVEWGARRLTYDELARRVDRIAHAIVTASGGRASPVALLLGEDVALIAAMLAVLRTGRPFVVLDRGQPDARAATVIDDAGAGLILSDARHFVRARALAGSRLAALNVDALHGDAPGPVIPQPSPDAPAYILYTSGSTGRPKGVLLNHRNVLHNILIHTNALCITPHDRLTLLSSRATGQAMTGVFSALLNGAALHPFDLRARGLSGLAAGLVEEGITIYHSSASIFRELVATPGLDLRSSQLRVVKLGSEPVSRKDVERFKECFPRDCAFVNALSSSETGTIRQIAIGHDTVLDGDGVPVGYPVPDVEVVLLGDDGAPVPQGEVGEICARSRFLALEYWRDPVLTRAAFTAGRDDPTLRLFRTGDLGKMTDDGCLTCLGRKDSRVKIRGNRVEVAEVENALLSLDSVKQAAVVDRDDGRGGQRLIAFIVPSGAVPDARALRAHVASRLPRHMMPSAFVVLEALPRTPAGKLDRSALPAWKPGAPRSEATAPRDLLETQVADVWKDLLGVHEVSIDDDFFELGGDSLLAVEMTIRLEKACGVNVPMQDMLAELTIAKLAAAIVDGDSTHAPVAQLQAGGTQRPFFFAHGAIASDGFYCRNLARALGSDRPFYVIHPHGSGGEAVPPTISDMAGDRLEHVLRVQPSGPYLLGGFCAGGAIVFEMARRLRERGQDVDLVVLIDTHAKNARFRSWSRIVGGASSMMQLGDDTRRRVFRRGRTFLAALRGASDRGAAEALRFILAKPFGALARGRAHVPASPPRGPLDARQAVWMRYHDALEDFVPERYAGRVVLLRTSHLDERTPGDFAAGWQHVCSSFEVHPIAGNHRTCVTTHVGELGATIRAYLDQVS